jgi:electron transport complex protein RnfG
MNVLTLAISRNSIALALFAVLTTGIIAATYLGTSDTIEINKRKAETRALNEIITIDRYDNELLSDTLSVSDSELLGLRAKKSIYFARKNNAVVAVILPATARDGYSGDIDLIVGINADGSLAGVRATNQKETPGLGDAIDHKKSNWAEQFTGRFISSLEKVGNPIDEKWKVKKDGGDFDQLTGATITPRAVVAATYRAQQYFAAHRRELLNSAASAKPNDATIPNVKNTGTQ